jgi:hypothetical protein
VLRVDPFTRVCKKWVLIFAAAAVAFANDDSHHRLRTRYIANVLSILIGDYDNEAKPVGKQKEKRKE